GNALLHDGQVLGDELDVVDASLADGRGTHEVQAAGADRGAAIGSVQQCLDLRSLNVAALLLVLHGATPACVGVILPARHDVAGGAESELPHVMRIEPGPAADVGETLG